ETYLRADAVTVLSDDLRDNVAAKIAGRRGPAGRSDKVRVIPNFIDTDWIRPGPKENSYRREYGLEGKRVVMYAGNVGLSQSLDLVLAAAAHLAHDPDVVFVINGGGAGPPPVGGPAARPRNRRVLRQPPHGPTPRRA